MQVRARVGAAALLTLAAPMLVACSGEEENPPETLVIGVTADQPGLGERSDSGTWTGFEVDLGYALARGLGYEASEIEFYPVVPANRERLVENGTVDMVLATYSVEEEQDAELDVAGPYYVAHEDLLVAADDDEINGPGDLGEEDTLCSVSGSGAAQAVEEEYAPEVRLREFDLLGQCVEALRAGEIDAITADDIVLAGYLQADPDGLRLVDEPFGERRYGIGLPPAGDDYPDAPGRDKVEALLQRSFRNGVWAQALSDNLGDSGLPLPSPPADEPTATPTPPPASPSDD